MKHLKGKLSLVFITLLILTSLSPVFLAQAEVTVAGPTIDAATGGDWRTQYGDCFYLIPNPFAVEQSESVGPDFFSTHPEQYQDTNCYGGELFNDDPNLSHIDWRIFRNDGGAPNAFAWHSSDTIPSSSQWNPCVGDFWHATWSNSTSLTDPLTVELNIKAGGNLKLAFYFTSAATAIRSQDFTLYINGEEKASGAIADIAGGKYVIFDINGLESSITGNLIKFTTQVNSPDSYNSHVSGVFISGTDICNDYEDSCVRPVYYWKRHPDAWPVTELIIGGVAYSQEKIIDIMKKYRLGRAYWVFKELAAAKLNMYAGAETSCIEAVMDRADQWLADHPPGDRLRRSDWREGFKLWVYLYKYNRGRLDCASRCP